MRKSAILRGMWGFGGIFGSFTRERTSAAVLGVAALKDTAEFIDVHDGLSALSGCCPPFIRCRHLMIYFARRDGYLC